MKQWWNSQAVRINALSLRERLFLFLSLLVICLALADMALLSPAQARHKQAYQALEKQNADLKNSREAMKLLPNSGSAAKVLNEELSAVRRRIDELDQSIGWSTTGPVDAQPLAQVLVHLLRRYEGLSLVSTSSMAAELDDKKMPADAATALPPGFSRQGLALTVSGPYAQLVAYVQTLEAAMPHVRWGTMRLKSEKQPPELKLHLFIVGVTP